MSAHLARGERGATLLNITAYDELSIETPTRILYLILDGLGGMGAEEKGGSELEVARTPHLVTRRKRYSVEFKREALKRANEEGVTDVLVAGLLVRQDVELRAIC